MWKLILYLVLNALLLVYFWRKQKALTPYEIAGCWLVATIFGDDWLTIAGVNLHLIQPTKAISLGLAFTLNRILFFRIIAVLFLDQYMRQRSWAQKIFVILLWTFAFVLIQQLSVLMGLYQYTGWKFWWSIPLWMAHHLILIGMHHVFRRLESLAKEGI